MKNRWLFGRMLTLVLLFSISVVSWSPPMSAASTQPLKADDKPHLDKLVGAWNIDATGPTHPPVPALLVFTSDGIVMGARPPLPFETPSYGNWITIDDENAAFTFMALTGSEKGPFSAKMKIRGTIHYDTATDSWRGPNHLDVYDPSGTLVFSDTGELSGTRIAVEPLDTSETKHETAGDGAEKQEAANKAVVQRFYTEVVDQKNQDALKEIFDAKMIAHDLDFGAHGGDLGGVLTGLPDVKTKISLWVIKDDLVTAVVTFSGTHKGTLLGIAPTGKPVTFSLIDIWRVKNGKLVEIWHNVPNSDILAQIKPPAK